MLAAPIMILVVTATTSAPSPPPSPRWADDPGWHDGLVEQATYAATRVVYGKPRSYEAIFFTNKEQHDAKTLTKADKSTNTIEVWKHNQVETIPTPNYPYHYVTTSQLTVDGLQLTRLDCSSQEFCGTSFKQYLCEWPRRAWVYQSFSYMPETGQRDERYEATDTRPVVAFNSLPLWLRDYPFKSEGGWAVRVLPDQRSNRATPAQPIMAQALFAGDDGDAFKIKIVAVKVTAADGKVLQEEQLLGTFWMAKDRLHVMTKFVSGDGQQTYELKHVERVNYWTIRGE